jgi:hypothetical protein
LHGAGVPSGHCASAAVVNVMSTTAAAPSARTRYFRSEVCMEKKYDNDWQLTTRRCIILP